MQCVIQGRQFTPKSVKQEAMGKNFSQWSKWCNATTYAPITGPHCTSFENNCHQIEASSACWWWLSCLTACHWGRQQWHLTWLRERDTLTSIANGSKGVGIAECQNPAVVLEGSLLSFLPFLVVFMFFFSYSFLTSVPHTPTFQRIHIYFSKEDDLLRIFLIKNAKNIPPTNQTEHILNAEQKLWTEKIELLLKRSF